MAETPTIYTPRHRAVGPARYPLTDPHQSLRTYREAAEAAIAEPFLGVTADGEVAGGLFAIAPTGVSTAPIGEAVSTFLASLTAEQQERTQFSIDSDNWRRWSNIHPFTMRHGSVLEDLSDLQRDAALAVMRSTLSEAGYQTARDVMRLNETMREITGSDLEYGEFPYWLSIFGTPSASGPWGWQIDGHHLIVNCFVLGDQVVMTPMFMGSEPVLARVGKYKGTRVFATEESQGLELMRSLTPEQQKTATIGTELPSDVLTSGFHDNVEMPYQGVRFGDMSGEQQGLLLKTLETYIGRMRDGHAAVRMAEVKEHLSETFFSWIGQTRDDSVYYYRIHSPVILIEFDHQRGVALDVDQPFRDHIHTIIRTPNGNDYGKDLLRQHYQRYDHSNGSHTPR